MPGEKPLQVAVELENHTRLQLLASCVGARQVFRNCKNPILIRMVSILTCLH